jgi:hypothetical protein
VHQILGKSERSALPSLRSLDRHTSTCQGAALDLIARFFACFFISSFGTRRSRFVRYTKRPKGYSGRLAWRSLSWLVGSWRFFQTPSETSSLGPYSPAGFRTRESSGVHQLEGIPKRWTSSPPGILRVANGAMGAFRERGFSAEPAVCSFYALYDYVPGGFGRY